MSHYVIEIQGFTGRNKNFVLKELTMMNVETQQIIFNALVTSPYSFNSLSPQEQRVVNYVSKNIIQLRWEDGIITFTHLLHKILKTIKPDDTVYTKGNIKCKFLTKILNRHVVDLGETFCCPSLKVLRKNELAEDCPFHNNPKESCSLTSARQISVWMNEHIADRIYTTKTQ
jgi:hypothetical protein